MKGDYIRYICEIASGTFKHENAQKGLFAYQAAADIATNELPPTHPIRLGLALSFSAFYYDIMGNPAKGLAVSKQAFDDAIAEIDSLPEGKFEDISFTMQMLRDSLCSSLQTLNEEP